MPDTEPGAPVFAPEGASAREALRIALDASATAMRRDRLAASGEIDTDDYALADRIAELGFSGEAEAVFDLLPLVVVAWADGKVQTAERALILGLLTARGYRSGKAFTVIEALLERRPSEAYLQEALVVLRQVLGADAARAKTVVEQCVAVAEAAGGFLRLLPAVSRAERDAIANIAEALGDDACASYRSHFA